MKVHRHSNTSELFA
uniref:Uncharacterized protein n=1 Tax=Rhizophora mucronata TaxID=61149 RepID=A0A2P2PT89_RHIMU